MYTIGPSCVFASVCVSVISDRSFVCLLCVSGFLWFWYRAVPAPHPFTLWPCVTGIVRTSVCAARRIYCRRATRCLPVVPSQTLRRSELLRLIALSCHLSAPLFIYLSVVFVRFPCWVGSQCCTMLVLDVCFSPVAELVLRFYIMNKLNKRAEFLLSLYAYGVQ